MVSEKESGKTTADIYFEDYEKVFSDMPRIAEQIGVDKFKAGRSASLKYFLVRIVIFYFSKCIK